MSRLGSSNLFLTSLLQKTNQPTRCGYCLFFCIRLRSSRTVTFTLSCLVLSCLGINICWSFDYGNSMFFALNILKRCVEQATSNCHKQKTNRSWNQDTTLRTLLAVPYCILISTLLTSSIIISCFPIFSIIFNCLFHHFSSLLIPLNMARQDHMARTKKHVSEMSEPARKKSPAYALRLPLRMCESADGDIYPSSVDTLETKAGLDRKKYLQSYAHSFAMRKRAPDLSKPVKIPRAYALRSPLPTGEISDGEFIQSVVKRIPTVVYSLPTEADLNRNERDRAKALSFAMRKRVAEMHLQPPRFAALKKHCLDVIEGLQAGMYPPYAIDNADGVLSPSRTDASQTTVNRKFMKLRKRYYNDRHSWTWTDHFKLHHTVWLSNYVLRVPVEGLQTKRYRNEGLESFNKTLSKRCNMFNSDANKGRVAKFDGGCYQCRADGAVYVRDCLHDPQQHLVSLFAVAPGTRSPINVLKTTRFCTVTLARVSDLNSSFSASAPHV